LVGRAAIAPIRYAAEMDFLATPAASLIFAVTILTSLVALFAVPSLIEQNLFRPYWLLRKQQYATVITSGFIHADLGHLLFNMLTFYFFAFPLERAIGTTRFFALYVFGLIVSSVGTYYKHRTKTEYASLGASGAILAVLFASIVYFPTQSLFIIPIPVPIPAPLFALSYLAYSIYQSKHSQGRINHDAHLSGAVAGIVFVALTDAGAFANALRMVTG